MSATSPRQASPALHGARTPFSAARLARLESVVQRDIDHGRLPGAAWLICHRDKVVQQCALGLLDPAGTVPLALDSIFRIYSMTKPIVSVALMMLVERGRLLISDPVSRYLPELSGLQVGVEQPGTAGGPPSLKLVPAERDITVLDLLRHTAGLTYGIFGESLVKQAYRRSPVESRSTGNGQLPAELGKLPLFAQPGRIWEYSRATDLLGALIERISGQELDAFLEQHILQPLGMQDSGFWVPESQQFRVAEPFALDPDSGQPIRLLNVRRKPGFLSGGGGMVSTLPDYLRFARMLASGGTLDGVEILSPQTVALMTADHLADLPGAKSGPSYLPGPGYGFGLGFAVRTHAAALTPGSIGDFNWSGLGGTYFWIDPQQDLIAIWMMQAPEQRAHYRQLFRNLVYAAL